MAKKRHLAAAKDTLRAYRLAQYGLPDGVIAKYTSLTPKIRRRIRLDESGLKRALYKPVRAMSLLRTKQAIVDATMFLFFYIGAGGDPWRSVDIDRLLDAIDRYRDQRRRLSSDSPPISPLICLNLAEHLACGPGVEIELVRCADTDCDATFFRASESRINCAFCGLIDGRLSSVRPYSEETMLGLSVPPAFEFRKGSVSLAAQQLAD